MRYSFGIAIVLVLAATAAAVEPSTKPADPAADWMLSQATTKPATTRTATAPASSPLTNRNAPSVRSATITLSDGTKLTGPLTTTPLKPLRMYVEETKEYVDVPIDDIASMKAAVVWERDEKEWQFKLSGSDEKVYSGKTYPARETTYTIKTMEGKEISGSIAAPLYLKRGDESKTLVLHKRDKGEVGQTLKQLIYVKEVQFDAP
jgi:hypothetical protein